MFKPPFETCGPQSFRPPPRLFSPYFPAFFNDAASLFAAAWMPGPHTTTTAFLPVLSFSLSRLHSFSPSWSKVEGRRSEVGGRCWFFSLFLFLWSCHRSPLPPFPPDQSSYELPLTAATFHALLRLEARAGRTAAIDAAWDRMRSQRTSLSLSLWYCSPLFWLMEMPLLSRPSRYSTRSHVLRAFAREPGCSGATFLKSV